MNLFRLDMIALLISLFRRQYAIADLRKYMRAQSAKIDRNLYRKCKILIIDDDAQAVDYPFAGNIAFLRSQFNCDITTKTDLDNIPDAAGYDIIICDCEGVGQRLGGSDGIWLVKQLQAAYVDKIYVLFSSVKFPLRKIRRVKNILWWDKNELLRSSEENGDGGLTDSLRGVMGLYADPVRRWEKIRTQLFEFDLSIHSVAKLESAYVRSIVRNAPAEYERAMAAVDLSGTQGVDADKYVRSAVSFIKTAIDLISMV